MKALRSVLLTTALPLLLGGALLTGAPCALCDCIASPPPLAARDSADAVFRGRVISVEDRPLPAHDAASPGWPEAEIAAWMDRYFEQRRATFQVTRVWKGHLAAQAEVFTSLGGGDCGYPFVAGAEYLVYAKRAPTGRLGTTICFRTRPVLDAVEDLAALGAGILPRSDTSRSSRRPHI